MIKTSSENRNLDCIPSLTGNLESSGLAKKDNFQCAW